MMMDKKKKLAEINKIYPKTRIDAVTRITSTTMEKKKKSDTYST